jgi:signal transduction histidine kinase/ligand-binding sensor domain-containing protein/DNA-binding response OmpR family regulator
MDLHCRKIVQYQSSYLTSIIFTILFIVFHGAHVSAQSERVFTVQSELSSSLVNDIFQDRYQVIWIATENGLNRYDGSKFKVYKGNRGDSTTILHDYVRVFMEDTKGRLFIGFVNGLQQYDHEYDQFRTIPLYLQDGSQFPTHITTILQRKNGDILLGTSGHGLFKLYESEGKIWCQQIPTPPSYFIKTLYEDRQQNLWICSQDNGLFVIDDTYKAKRVPVIGDNGNVQTLCEDKRGKLYAGSTTTGLYTYDSTARSFKTLLPNNKKFGVNKLLVDRSGSIIIGSEGNGLLIYAPSSRKLIQGNFSINNIDLSKLKVHALFEDNTHNLWIGVYQKGIVLLPSQSNQFQYYGHRSVLYDYIGSSQVSSIHKDDEGTLWVGTDGEGLFNFNLKSNKHYHFDPEDQTSSMPKTILKVFEDSNKKMWLGTYDNGIVSFDTKTKKSKSFNHLFVNNDSPIRVFDIIEDRDKNLWIATMGHGLFSYNIKTEEVKKFRSIGPNYKTDLNILHNDWISVLHLSKNKKLYIGTADGLGCYDLETKKFNAAFNGYGRYFPGFIIHDIHEDNNGILWLATSEGLISFDEKNADILSDKMITYLSTRDGLSTNVIFSVLSDSLGNLWVGTNYGLSKVDKATLHITNYLYTDGLQGNEFTRAKFADKSRLYFGGANGITSFEPSNIKQQQRNLELKITGFYIHNTPVRKGMKSGGYDITTKSVMESDRFELSQKDNSFTIEFSSMDFINPERISYMYSLEGQKNWIELVAGKNTISFNDLSPGTYTFNLRAKDNLTFSDPKTITIVIHPFWYLSTLAKTGYAILFTIIISIILYLLRQRQISQREVQEQIHLTKLNESKIQFFINIAHEIRTPMMLIISPLKKLMMRDKDRDRQRSYAIINRNSERILHLVNQLMDIQRVDLGQLILDVKETELVDFISKQCEVFEEQSRTKDIKITFTHRVPYLYSRIDPNNFDKVIINLISNALKFTPTGGHIEIFLSKQTDISNPQQPNLFEIEVRDTGDGILEDDLEKVFDCFYQSQHHDGGTGIGLYLSRSIVELHGGKIWVENHEDKKGCRFIIRMPLEEQTQEHEIIPASANESKTIASKTLRKHDNTIVAKVKSKSTHKILLVEDDSEILHYLETELNEDYHVATSKNGKEALQYILTNKPDVVITDLTLPELDGMVLCEKIKQNVNINHIAVIIMTGKIEEKYFIESLGIGVDGYLQKPFNVDILKKTIYNALRNREILRNKYSGSQEQADKIQDVVITSSNEKLLTRIMDSINKNISNPDLNVEMLSREVGISRVHLHRKLKELTNQSTRDLIRNIRLQQAAKLLTEKQMNITEVAFSTGFANIGHFSNAFKDFFGMPPSQYMEHHKVENKSSKV